MKRELSTVAQCAKAVREELRAKFPDITFRVTSKNYSGGDSVDIEWDLGPTTKEVSEIARRYEYGKFDGMTDMYEHTNRIKGLPQTKYLFTHRIIPEEARQQMLANWSYQEPEQWNRHHEKDEVLYRILAQQSFPKGAHNFRVVDNLEKTAGLLEDFYKIEYDLPAPKPAFHPTASNPIPSQNERIKMIEAKFNSKCAETGARIWKGEVMLYNYDLKKCYSASSNTFKSFSKPDEALGMIEAQEEACFDSFCQTNNI